MPVAYLNMEQDMRSFFIIISKFITHFVLCFCFTSYF
jgi:hypothetical protein